MAPREWQVEAHAGWQKANGDRVRACIDTLVENALRYTTSGDVVRVFARLEGETFVFGVADSGPGLNQTQQDAINAPLPDSQDVPLISDPRSQTGLGLSLVRDAVESRGGRLVAGRAREGGAEVYVVCLRYPSASPSRLRRPTVWAPLPSPLDPSDGLSPATR